MTILFLDEFRRVAEVAERFYGLAPTRYDEGVVENRRNCF
jgi:hypothetical protein